MRPTELGDVPAPAPAQQSTESPAPEREEPTIDLTKAAAIDGVRRVECECGTLLRAFALPFGDVRGTFRARCRDCRTAWSLPLSVVLADADSSAVSTVRLSSVATA